MSLPVEKHETWERCELTWRFPGAVSTAEVKRQLTEAGYYPEGFGCSCTYDCCGCWFGRSIDINLENDETIVTQVLLRNV